MIINVCNIIGPLHVTCQHILTKDLNVRQTVAKSLLHLLNDDKNM
jgi:hypothetical protein